MKPHVHVACAIIERDGLVLAAQRSESMNLPLKWEFPGGKLEAGETPGECVVRELHEELDVRVGVGPALPTATHSYATFTVTLYPFLCSLDSGEMIVREHRAVVWLEPGRMLELDWAEADLPVIADYLARRGVFP